MQSINNILNDYFNKNNDVDKMKNDKLITLINQISGDGSTVNTPKKIIGVSVVSETPIITGGNADQKKILESPEIMKQYLEDLKTEPKYIVKDQKRIGKIHKFYSESSEF
jgi:predicted transcriptional regulator